MRRIAAHYLFSRGEVIPRPVVECDSEGVITKVEQWERLDNLAATEFYAGALTAGFVNAHCHSNLRNAGIRIRCLTNLAMALYCVPQLVRETL